MPPAETVPIGKLKDVIRKSAKARSYPEKVQVIHDASGSREWKTGHKSQLPKSERSLKNLGFLLMGFPFIQRPGSNPVGVLAD